ncbi:MAG TPA: hypothetical protein VLS89_15585 [Candidatus Nanopelagicales bacterium]|nr:hypothetical protein [Candidatus Nanopelagicales bacterium]
MRAKGEGPPATLARTSAGARAARGLAELPAVAADLAPFIAALADLVIADLSRDPPREPD